MSFSIENCTYKMFDAETGKFIKPNPENIYDWPADRLDSDSNPLVKDWNTWARCLGYWLRDKFDFDIFSGDGSSFGIIGRKNNLSYGSDWWTGDSSLYFEENGNGRYLPQDWKLPTNKNSQRDNDWSNNDYGLFPMGSDETGTNRWEEYRAPSPFRPQQVDGVNYYTDGTVTEGKLNWTGKWNNQTFDDENNRFDIILQPPNFNNLGIRIKYPLTTTTTRCYASDYGLNSIWDENQAHYAQDWNTLVRHSDTTCFMGIIPFLTAALNKKQIAKLSNCSRWLSNWSFLGFSTSVLKYLTDDFSYIFLPQKYVGLVSEKDSRIHADSNPKLYTIKKNGTVRWYAPDLSDPDIDVIEESSTVPIDITTGYLSNLTYLGDSNRKNIFSESPGIEPFGWTKNIFEKFTDVMYPYLFENTGKQYNYIRYYTSYDSSVLYLTILDSSSEKKGAELIFYKNEDNTSGLLISEAIPQTRNQSKSWYSNGENKYWTYRNDTDRNYGNIGGLIVSSSDTNEGLDNFEVTPLKYYKDARDILVDETGYWCLEKLRPLSNKETYCKQLYLVTRAGTSDYINEFKKITCTINNVKTNFIVFPFNNKYLRETDMTDSLTLLAIPIEQEV